MEIGKQLLHYQFTKCMGDTVRIIGQCNLISDSLYRIFRITHGNTTAGSLEHRDVIFGITECCRVSRIDTKAAAHIKKSFSLIDGNRDDFQIKRCRADNTEIIGKMAADHILNVQDFIRVNR